FTDPAHPGKTYMVFEGNTGGPRGARTCTDADLGYAPNDPNREDLNAVMNSGAVYQKANVGLAVATNPQLTEWKFLPPILSANCVDDQTERPQIYLKDGSTTCSRSATARRWRPASTARTACTASSATASAATSCR
ncbi:glycoside hydrolase family 68 protein, partial [Staphylococcus capitis]|nr:glycoside hydrolase family 68 protein [Staphylococcus capitis]